MIHGISRHPASVPQLVINPHTAPIVCPCAGVAPAATSRVATTVGAQKFDDHRPKIMHAISSAAAQVVRACPRLNNAQNADSPLAARRGGSLLLRRR